MNFGHPSDDRTWLTLLSFRYGTPSVLTVGPPSSEGTLSCWSRLHLQSSGWWPVVNIFAESLSQHDEKHVVPTPFSVIRGGERRWVSRRNEMPLLPLLG
jgi:hypothetical protein